MSKAWPGSLFGRNTLLLVVLVVLGQAGGALLVRELILRPRVDRMAEGLSRNIEAIRTGIAGLPPEMRQPFVDRFNDRAMNGAAPAGPGRLVGPDLVPLDRQLIAEVSSRIGHGGSDISWRRDAGGSLAVHTRIGDAYYWIVLAGVLPPSEATGAWLGASAAAALLALAGALLIQRRLNRPLAQVVKAAAILSAGGVPAALAEDGPRETATLARSVNRMVESLERTAHERALMLAGISHDLRTPLAKLRLGVEILAPKADAALYTSMERSIAEMDGIVGQFLDFARAGAVEPMVTVSLDEIAREAVAASVDHGRPVAFAPGATPAIALQPALLLRAVGNLLENAWRHGSAPITLATGTDVRGIWLEVRDHGRGIAATDTESLKQPFRTASAARGGSTGTGLGLAIVERAARAHGGGLDLANAPGGGLCARLWLPLPRA